MTSRTIPAFSAETSRRFTRRGVFLDLFRKMDGEVEEDFEEEKQMEHQRGLGFRHHQWVSSSSSSRLDRWTILFPVIGWRVSNDPEPIHPPFQTPNRLCSALNPSAWLLWPSALADVFARRQTARGRSARACSLAGSSGTS